MASKLKLTELLYPTSTTAAITINSDDSVTIPTQSTTNLAYTGTLTGGTGVVNLGSGQFYKDASGNVGIGTSSPSGILDARGAVYLGNTSSGTVAVVRGAPNWNFAGLNVIRNAANTGNPRSIAMPLDGDNLASTTIGEYNAIWGAYDSSPTTSSTSSALNGAMVYGAYAGHRWVTNGTERMRIDSSGNVGIGTSSPLAKLQVYPTVGAPASSGNLNTGVIFAEGGGGPSLNMGNFNSGGTYYAWIQSAFVNNAAVVQPLVLQQIGGNVGIGTASPAQKLHVVGAIIGQSTDNYFGNYSSGAYVDIGNLGTSDVWLDTRSDTLTNVPLQFRTKGTGEFVWTQGASERMRIDSSGNVGIGTASPSSYGKLTVDDTAASSVYIRSSSTNFSGLLLDNTNSATKWQIGVEGGTYNTAGILNIGVSGVGPALIIDTSRNLLVGITSTLNDGKVTLRTPSSFTGYGFRSDSVTAAGTTWGHFYGTSSTNSVANIIIFGNGNIQNANNSYGALSDSKLKENIVDATPKLEKLNQVRVVNFNLIGDEQKQLGVIAQELEQIFPGMIDETIDRDAEGKDLGTTTKSVKYSVFVPMLIKAIQELKAEVDALKGAA